MEIAAPPGMGIELPQRPVEFVIIKIWHILGRIVDLAGSFKGKAVETVYHHLGRTVVLEISLENGKLHVSLRPVATKVECAVARLGLDDTGIEMRQSPR